MKRGRTARSRGIGTASHPPAPGWIYVLLAALVVLVYAPVRDYEFINVDDAQYVSGNPMVAKGLTRTGAVWALTTGEAGNWHPLTWLSHMLDVQLFGPNPGAHHLVNAALHLANTLLLFAALFRMTGAPGSSAFVAAVFGTHPLHVESVAWIAERKDVLSTFFGFLALWGYAGYVRRPGALRHGAVCLLFTLALMAKPMWVTFPFLLLLLDSWPLDRRETGWRTRFVEKLPLFWLSVASSVVTVLAQQRAGALRGLEALPFARRAANACLAYLFYLLKTLLPLNLAAIYPYPEANAGMTLAAFAALVLVSIGVWRARRRHPYLLVGWLWTLGTLVPVIGLVQVGSQPWADRYSYLPMVGLLIMAAWGIPAAISSRAHGRAVLSVAAPLAIVACAFTARSQVAHWRTSVSLWEHALAVTTGNARAHHNLAHALALRARVNEAVPHYLEALRLSPAAAETHNNLGHAYAELGRRDEAIAHYNEALRLSPDYPEARNNFGVALLDQGKTDDAIREFREAARTAPRTAGPHKNLGLALSAQDRSTEAIPHLLEAVRLDPDDARTLNALGVALAQGGKLDEAIERYRAASLLDPGFVDARVNLGRALAEEGRTGEALVELQAALRLNPGEADFHYDVAVLLHRIGRSADALPEFEAALALDPRHEPARRALEALRAARRVGARE